MTADQGDRRESLGSWLRRRREEKGLGIDRAARMSGVAATTFRRVELGDTPSIEVARQIAEGLELDSIEVYRRVGYALGMRKDRRGANAAARVDEMARDALKSEPLESAAKSDTGEL